jgi:glycosyltransferase involved in cell wall biosynthesis
LAVTPRLSSRTAREPSYLAVIPAYNESSTLAEVIGLLRARARLFDPLVIDDGSTDDTGALGRSYCSST